MAGDRDAEDEDEGEDDVERRRGVERQVGSVLKRLLLSFEHRARPGVWQNANFSKLRTRCPAALSPNARL
jgi:hypothetical protein